MQNTAGDRLIGYALSETDPDFEKHDYEDVADIANRELDKAEARLKALGRRDV